MTLAVGDIITRHVRYAAQYTPDPGGIAATGRYRVTAVRGDRAYVTHLDGAQYCDGVFGWDNQWVWVES